MSRLDDLIAELCPDGVECFELQNIFNIKNGYTPSKSISEYWNNGTIPWFRMEDIRLNGGILTGSLQHITKQAVKGKLFPENSIIIATSATIGVHALLTVPALANQRFTFLSRKKEYYNKIDMKYFYYYCFIIDEWCLNNTTLGNFLSVDMTKFKRYKIPVPPLPVQQEIVRILDNFTELSTKLDAELTARKKQYEYYRDELLTFGDDVEWKTLGDEFPFIRNGFVGTVTSYFTDKEKGIPYLRGTNIHNGVISDDDMVYVTKEFHKKHIKTELKEDDILMVQSGHVGESSVVGTNYIGANCHALIVMSNGGNCNSKFISYYFQSTEGKNKLWRITTGGTVKHILASKMKKFIIPVPTMEIQNKIVEILDNFNTITNDISQGLPAEIEARQKQYEYYRDKLLTFKEKVS